ncbi:protein DMP2-like [Malania oleifera]|uniref:protein DMP2-like n=1 Tax=Malania oleifera TaxID=397392 RepID=UPI0025AE7D7D|nr:protein DMP2-like [Malania oleifera]
MQLLSLSLSINTHKRFHPYIGKETYMLSKKLIDRFSDFNSKAQMAGSSSEPSSSTSQKKSYSDMTFSGIGNLIKLLPTGTVFAFQFLNPVLSNNGQCHTVNKVLTSVFVGLCGLSCFFSSFTDSYTGSDGATHYGIATMKGLWPSPDSGKSVDLSQYKLQMGDFVHALFSVVVFAALALLDPNTVDCFYPSFESTQKALMMSLPPVIGVVASAVFAMFPSRRHGIGYPSSSNQSTSNE